MMRYLLLCMALLFGAMALRAQDDISPELRDLIEQRIATIAEQLGRGSLHTVHKPLFCI